MNRKLTAFADKLELFGSILLLFSALRADGGLAFWLPTALAGILVCVLGLVLGWLCSQQGRVFRRRMFGIPSPVPAITEKKVIAFPKAG